MNLRPGLVSPGLCVVPIESYITCRIFNFAIIVPSHFLCMTAYKPSRALSSAVSYAAILLAGVVACAASRAGHLQPVRLAAVHADTAALRQRLDSIADAHHGVVGY